MLGGERNFIETLGLHESLTTKYNYWLKASKHP